MVGVLEMGVEVVKSMWLEFPLATMLDIRSLLRNNFWGGGWVGRGGGRRDKVG